MLPLLLAYRGVSGFPLAIVRLPLKVQPEMMLSNFVDAVAKNMRFCPMGNS